MAYSLSVEDRGTHVHATVEGELNVETDATIDERLRQECEDRGTTLLLVDIRGASSRMSVFENHQAATTFRQRIGNRIRAVAIVERADFRRNSQMYELTSGNRGARVRFFESPEEAAAWLLTHSPGADSTESDGERPGDA